MSYRKVGLILLALLATANARAASFQGLGDLPGWYYWNRVHAVSGDGLAAAGQSVADVGYRAYQWEAGTLTDLRRAAVPACLQRRLWHIAGWLRGGRQWCVRSELRFVQGDPVDGRTKRRGS